MRGIVFGLLIVAPFYAAVWAYFSVEASRGALPVLHLGSEP